MHCNYITNIRLIMKKEVDKEKLERYRAALPWGGQLKAAKRAGVTKKSVSDFLNGIYRSTRIEFAILEVIAEHKSKFESLQKAAGL